MQSPRPPFEDREAVGVRFGCGALFGLIVGLGSIYSLPSVGPVIAVAVALALVCGGLSARYGERFWSSASRWLGWW